MAGVHGLCVNVEDDRYFEDLTFSYNPSYFPGSSILCESWAIDARWVVIPVQITDLEIMNPPRSRLLNPNHPKSQHQDISDVAYASHACPIHSLGTRSACLL